MGFYDLTKLEREQKYKDIQSYILRGLTGDDFSMTISYFDDGDTYIRKAAYLGIGRMFKSELTSKQKILDLLNELIKSDSGRVRQTVINAAGEIAMADFAAAEHLLMQGITDSNHSVRNAVQGSLKKAGEKNPRGIIPFCKKIITNADPEIRRSAAHGLELRGRTHPEDVMPALRLLQFEKHKRVRPMVVHIFGQISYKKGCLEKVTAELLTWEDKALAEECFKEIVKQHYHIDNHFSTVETLPPKECEEYIRQSRNSAKDG